MIDILILAQKLIYPDAFTANQLVLTTGVSDNVTGFENLVSGDQELKTSGLERNWGTIFPGNGLNPASIKDNRVRKINRKSRMS